MATERDDYQLSIGLDASGVGEGLAELPEVLGQIQAIVDQTSLGSLTAFRGKGAELGRAVLAGFRQELTGPTDLARSILSQLDLDPSKVERQAERYVGALERVRRVALEAGMPVSTTPQVQTGSSLLALKALEDQGARARRQLADVNAQLRLLGSQMRGLSGITIPSGQLYRRDASGGYELTQSAQRAAQALGTRPELQFDTRGRVDQAAARNALAASQQSQQQALASQVSRLRLEQSALKAGQIYTPPAAITSQPGLAASQAQERAAQQLQRAVERENRVIDRWERLVSRIEKRTGQTRTDSLSGVTPVGTSGRLMFDSPQFRSPGERYVASRAEIERDQRGPTRTEIQAARRQYELQLQNLHQQADAATNGYLLSKSVMQARAMERGIAERSGSEVAKMHRLDPADFFHPNPARRITNPKYMSGELQDWLEQNPLPIFGQAGAYSGQRGGFIDLARQPIPESMQPIALESSDMVRARRAAEEAFAAQQDLSAAQRRAAQVIDPRTAPMNVLPGGGRPFVGTTTGVLGRAQLAITGAQMPTGLLPFDQLGRSPLGGIPMAARPEDLAREAARRLQASRMAPYFEAPQRPPLNIGELARVTTSVPISSSAPGGAPVDFNSSRMTLANRLYAGSGNDLGQTIEALKGLGLKASDAKAYAQAAEQAAGAQARATATAREATPAQEQLAGAQAKAAGAANTNASAQNRTAAAEEKAAAAGGGGGGRPPVPPRSAAGEVPLPGGVPRGGGAASPEESQFNRIAREGRRYGSPYTPDDLEYFSTRAGDRSAAERVVRENARGRQTGAYDMPYQERVAEARAQKERSAQDLLVNRHEGNLGLRDQFMLGFKGTGDRSILEQLGQTAKFSTFYGGAYKALFMLSQGFSMAVKGALDFESGLTDLNIVTERSRSQNERFADSLSEIGTNMGVGPGETLNTAVQAIGLFDLADLPQNDQRRQQTEVTTVAARIASLSKTDVSNTAVQLAGTMRAFQLPNEDASRIEDIVTYIGRRSGRPGADILQSLGLIGNLAGSAGFTPETTAAIVARLTSSTGQTPTTAAGAFRQILTKADDPTALAAMRALGVKTEGTTLADQIQQLAGMNLTQSQQNQIIQKFGRGNAGQALGIILDQMPQIQNLAEGAQGAQGAGEKAFNQAVKAIGMQLRILGSHVQQLLKDLATSGILDILAAVVKVLDLGVQAADYFVDTFNALPHSLRSAAFAIGELTLALAILAKTTLPGAGVARGVIALLSGTVGRGVIGGAGGRFVAGRAAGVVEGAAVSTAGSAGGVAAGGLLARLFGRGPGARTFVVGPEGVARATTALGATSAGQAFTAARLATTSAASSAAGNAAMFAAMAGTQFTGAMRRAGSTVADGFRSVFRRGGTGVAGAEQLAVREATIRAATAPIVPRPAFPGGAAEAARWRRELGGVPTLGTPTPAFSTAAEAAAQRKAVNAAAAAAADRAVTSTVVAMTVTDVARRVPGVLALRAGAAAAGTAAVAGDATKKTIGEMLRATGRTAGGGAAGAAGAAEGAAAGGVAASMGRLFPAISKIGGLAGRALLGPIGLALAAVGGIADAYSQNSAADNTYRSAQRATMGVSTPEQMRAAAAAQAQAQKEAQKQQDFTSWRSLLTLGIAPLYNKLGFSDSSNRVDAARSNRKALEDQATKLEEARKQAQAASPEVAFDNFSTADSVSEGLKKLADSGYSATERLAMLNRAFDALISKSGETAGAVGVLFQGQGAEFAAGVGGAAGGALKGFIGDLRNKQNSSMWSTSDSSFWDDLVTGRPVVSTILDAFSGDQRARNKAGDLADALEKQDVTKLQSKVGQRALTTLTGRGKDPSKGLVTLSDDDVKALQDATAKELQGLIGPKTWASMTPDQRKSLTQQFVTQFRTTLKGFGGVPTDAAGMQGFLAGAQQESDAVGQQTYLQTGDALAGSKASADALRSAGAKASAALANIKDPTQHAEAARWLKQNDLAIAQAEQKEAESQAARIQSLLALRNAKLGLDDKVGRGQNTLQALKDQLASTTDVDQQNTLNAQILEQAQQNALDDIAARGANQLAAINPRQARARAAQQLATLREQAGKLTRGSEAFGQNVDQQTQLSQQIGAYDLDTQMLQAQAGIAPYDTRSQARIARQDAARRLKDAVAGGDPNEILRATVADSQAQFQEAQIKAAKNVAARAARLTPGAAVAGARDAVNNAKDQLNLYAEGTIEYYNALAQYHQAQQGLSDALLERSHMAGLLKLDMTDPVQMAQQAIRDAQAKLAAADSPDERRAAQVDLRNAQAGGEAAAFQQRLTDVQFAESMGRISHAAYLQYLQSEHNRLTSRIAGMKRTDTGYRQAIDELQQIDGVMKTAVDQLQGQFNLGDIKVPTVYEVRRAMNPNAGMASSLADYSTTTVNINGADFAAVVQYIQKYLGGPAATVRTSSPRKV